jgi:hypothetical protein
MPTLQPDQKADLQCLEYVQEKLDAAKAMQRAIAVAHNSTAAVAVVASHFESLQVCRQYC